MIEFEDMVKLAEKLIENYKFENSVAIKAIEHCYKKSMEIERYERPNVLNNITDFIKELVSWGAGPRATQYLVLAAKTKSIMEGRFTPNIDDIRNITIPVLRHRIIPSFNAEAEGITSVDIINKLLK